ncbi:MAG: Cof-type HAD-IIB family hydrolase [Dysgonamonadaceae bacterium]
MKYKLLVIDVDDTMLNSQGEISKRTHATIRKVQQMGIKVVLASGRPTHGLKRIAEEIELKNYDGYFLSYNGGQIFKCQKGHNELLFEKRINPELLPLLEEKARQLDLDIFTYHQDFIITNNPDNPHIKREAEINQMRLIQVDNLSESIDFWPCKCMLVSDDENILLSLEEHWHKRLNGSLDVFRSESYYLEAVPPFIDKGNTLGILLDILKIKPEEVVAIGDGVRDFSMIQMVGLGVAMGNAKESVRACADIVTLSNDQDGAAAAIEKIFLSDIQPSKIPLEQLNASSKYALMGNLGIQYTYADESRIEATMPVDERTRQPFGILHGGATLALAETLAGIGSLLICPPDEIAVGMQISGNHISSAHQGDTVRAVATIVHKGRSSHVWNIDVFTSTGKLISSVRVVNSIMKKR